MATGAWAEVPYQLISDFESGELAPWQPSVSPTGWSMKVERGNARAGAYALHFVLERRGSDSYRAEATVDDQNPQGYSGRFDWDTEYWVGMSIQLVGWVPDVVSGDFFLQFHGLIPHDKERKGQHCMNANAYSFVTRAYAPGTWQLRVQNATGCPVGPGALAGSHTAWRGPIDEAWVDWVFNFRLSPGPDGFTKVWRDETLVHDYSGPNIRSHFRNCCQEISPRERQHYLKIGPYKPRGRRGPCPSTGASSGWTRSISGTWRLATTPATWAWRRGREAPRRRASPKAASPRGVGHRKWYRQTEKDLAASWQGPLDGEEKVLQGR